MSTQIFVNFPVKDLGASVDFFTELGYAFDPRMTDDKATCMIVADDIFVMLLVRDFFQTFTTKEVADAATHTEAILCLSAESRQGVDELVDKAMEAGARLAKEPMDQGPMYCRSFHDLDGHLWEILHMDPSGLDQ